MATDDENYPTDDAGTDQSLAITLEEGVALEFKPTGSGRQRYRIAARDDDLGWWLVHEEWTGCAWRPVGREPVRDVTIWGDNLPE